MDRSPSCGLYGVKRHTPDGSVLDTTRGIYADTFTKIHPLLPVEEAGRLDDEALRINFIIRVLTYHDWQQFLASRSKEHTSELQSRPHLVCRLLLEKKKSA